MKFVFTTFYNGYRRMLYQGNTSKIRSDFAALTPSPPSCRGPLYQVLAQLQCQCQCQSRQWPFTKLVFSSFFSMICYTLTNIEIKSPFSRGVMSHQGLLTQWKTRNKIFKNQNNILQFTEKWKYLPFYEKTRLKSQQSHKNSAN